MLNARIRHNSVYTDGYLYVIGGIYSCNALRECERFSVADSKWEAISPLPIAVYNHSVVVQESTQALYVIGGDTNGYSPTNAIQELNLRTQLWTQLSYTLPSASYGIPVFKSRRGSEDFYLVLDSKLYSWNPDSAPIQVKDLAANSSSFYGQSYYRQWTLYCSSYAGPVQQVWIGSLD